MISLCGRCAITERIIVNLYMFILPEKGRRRGRGKGGGRGIRVGGIRGKSGGVRGKEGGGRRGGGGGGVGRKMNVEGDGEKRSWFMRSGISVS